MSCLDELSETGGVPVRAWTRVILSLSRLRCTIPNVTKVIGESDAGRSGGLLSSVLREYTPLSGGRDTVNGMGFRDLSILIHSLAVTTPHVSAASMVKPVYTHVLAYIDDRITEISTVPNRRDGLVTRSSDWHIYLLKFFALVPEFASEFKYLFNYCLQSVSRSVHWERHKTDIFQVWISQMLEFPYIESNIHQPFLMGCMRQWLMDQAATTTQASLVQQSVSTAALALLTDQGEEELQHLLEYDYYLQGTPYYIEAAIPNKKKAYVLVKDYVINGRPDNSCYPTGNCAVKIRHITNLGWEVVPVILNVAPACILFTYVYELAAFYL